MKVIVYSTKECPWCKKTKEFLKENGVKFENKFVEDDEKSAKEMVKKSGQQGVPVTDIDGKIVVGFDEEKLKKLLKIN